MQLLCHTTTTRLGPEHLINSPTLQPSRHLIDNGHSSIFSHYLRQVLEAVSFCHENDIIHRDLKVKKFTACNEYPTSHVAVDYMYSRQNGGLPGTIADVIYPTSSLGFVSNNISDNF